MAGPDIDGLAGEERVTDAAFGESAFDAMMGDVLAVEEADVGGELVGNQIDLGNISIGRLLIDIDPIFANGSSVSDR